MRTTSSVQLATNLPPQPNATTPIVAPPVFEALREVTIRAQGWVAHQPRTGT